MAVLAARVGPSRVDLSLNCLSMPDRVLLVACDEKMEARLRKVLDAEGSEVRSVAGAHEIGAAVQWFVPTLVIVNDKVLAPGQVLQPLHDAGLADVRVSALSEKRDEYGAALGIGVIDLLVDWVAESCLGLLGCLGLVLLGVIGTLLWRWLFG